MMKKNRKNILTRTKRKKTKKRPLYLMISGGVLFFLFIFLVGNHGLIRYYQLQKRKAELVQQINQLKEEQTQLEQEIELITNNFRYIEKKAREIFQMGKKGEKIYFMVPQAEENKK